jgi:hypothetical protein
VLCCARAVAWRAEIIGHGEPQPFPEKAALTGKIVWMDLVPRHAGPDSNRLTPYGFDL